MTSEPADARGAGPVRRDDADVLVVDAANVVGSRPDGWWRDRAGAAARLHERLVATDLGADVVLVLEGRSRDGVPEGTVGRVRTVHAPAAGDDAIRSEAASAARRGRRTRVVTADRGLAARARAAGADVLGPSRLLDGLATPEPRPDEDPGGP
ncbi:hypothetical protein [Phycicoccus flavus]|uniref:hypothetical protein n=1 Tax=Phycicoccus flavus TaxID=2502783 RepID=UPI000FEC1B09|nr:hypothetical protein [Phycicoccus flavus]NHA69285.1 hypothetical protein [Phycicoccus flavus]